MAITAGEIKIRGNAVADLDFSGIHARAHRDNFGGNFVADNARIVIELHAPGARVVDGQARTTRQHTRDCLTGTGRGIGHSGDLKRLAGAGEQNSFHAKFSLGKCPPRVLADEWLRKDCRPE